jgi:hypothetical protein
MGQLEGSAPLEASAEEAEHTLVILRSTESFLPGPEGAKRGAGAWSWPAPAGLVVSKSTRTFSQCSMAMLRQVWERRSGSLPLHLWSCPAFSNIKALCPRAAHVPEVLLAKGRAAGEHGQAHQLAPPPSGRWVNNKGTGTLNCPGNQQPQIRDNGPPWRVALVWSQRGGC